MVRCAILLLIPLLLMGAGCSRQGPIDLPALEGKARAGEAAAFRELVGLLAVAENDVDNRAYAILTGMGQASVPFLRERLDTPDDRQREFLLGALGTLKVAEAVPEIAAILGDGRLQRRYVAAWALGEIGDPRALPALLAALDEEKGEVRRYATRSLIKFNREAVPALLAHLPTASPASEAAAIRALGDIGDGRALDSLLERVAGENRGEVFLALGKLKDPRAEKALTDGLRDPDWRVRMNAAMALGPVGSSASIPHLKKGLADEVMVVREWSARSLEMITGSHVTYRNERGEEVAPYSIYH